MVAVGIGGAIVGAWCFLTPRLRLDPVVTDRCWKRQLCHARDGGGLARRVRQSLDRNSMRCLSNHVLVGRGALIRLSWTDRGDRLENDHLKGKS